MCKHVVAAMYAVGARLDTQPQDLFILRHVEHTELITAARTANTLMPQRKSGKTLKDTDKDTDLSALFGIDIQESNAKNKTKKPKKSRKKYD